jgi:hypothetical protein
MERTPAASEGVQVICEGTQREMGKAQGKKMRATILKAIDTCLKDPTFREGWPAWVPTWVLVWVGKRRAAKLLSAPLRKDFPEMHERLIGMAEGSGLDLRLAYFCSAFEPILASKTGESVVPGCSSLAVRGSKSATGETVITRNFDYVPIIKPVLIVREDRPAGKYRSLQFTAATNCGAFDGINEHGLCITYNYGFVTDDAAPTGPISMLIVEALANCRTVAEAAKLIASRPRWGGAMLMLADAQGDMAALELSSTKSCLRRPAAGQDVLFHTNKFNTAEMEAVQVDEHAVFNEKAHESLSGHRVHESAELRFARLTELLSGPRPLTPDELIKVMGDHGKDNQPSQTTVCVHGPYQRTIASIQLLPKQRKMRVSFTTACEGKHWEVSL